MAEMTYELRTPAGEKPALCKVVYADAEEFVFNLSLQNKDELAGLSDEMIRDHINNLLTYLKEFAGTLEMSPAGLYPSEGMPIVHGLELIQLMDEINNWWTYVEFREEEPQVVYNT